MLIQHFYRCKFLIVTLVVLVLTHSAVQAQEEKSVSLQKSSVTIIAAASSERVRITAPASIVQMHVEIYAASGEKIFDNEIRGGNVFDWHLQDGQAQHLSVGEYVCVVTVKNIAGRLTQKIGTVRVGEKDVSVGPVQLTQVSPQQTEAIGPVEENSSWIVLSEKENQTTTVIAHDGNDGQIVRGRGALSFRLGDFFTGNDQEQMRLTEEGNLGIGTSEPKAKLDVAGTIRAERVLIAKPKTPSSNSAQATDTTDSPQPLASGTGTQNQVAKWLDNAGTLGDSSITETGGRVGIGTTNPTYKLVVGPDIGPGLTTSDLTVSRGAGQSISIFAGATGAHGMNFGWDEANQRAFVNAPVQSPITFTHGGVSERMRIETTGNVGIGTTAPAAVLHVVGSQPPPVSSGNGTNAAPVLQVIGGKGGSTSSIRGGDGANISIQAGDGGDASTPSLASAGGFGGSIAITAGNGGIRPGGDVSLGGSITLQAGNFGGSMRLMPTGGNVGIGLTAPLARLHVSGGGFGSNVVITDNNTTATTVDIANTSSGETWRLQSVGNGVAGRIGNFEIWRTITGANVLTFQSGGNVGIGTTAPQYKLHVVGQDLRVESSTPSSFPRFSLNFIGGAVDEKRWQNYAAPSVLNFSALNDAEDSQTIWLQVQRGPGANISSIVFPSGTVGIATGSPDHTLTVNGNADKLGGGSWDVFSDERLKNIKGHFTRGLKALMQLQPLRYEYKPDNALGLKSSQEYVGFGAQAVQKIIPEAVTKNEKGYLLVNNDPIMWTMLNAIKEQQQIIEKLQQENLKLKADTEARLVRVEMALKRMARKNRRHTSGQ